MRLDIITLFPELFEGPLRVSILGRAQERGLIDINLVQLRDYATDKYGTIDDRPYGGGPGMVLKPEPLFAAVEQLRTPTSRVILLTPQGCPLRQPLVEELAIEEHLILVCPQYEGVDERIRQGLPDLEISIGDYVLTNGNLAAWVLVDAVARLVPGVVGTAESVVSESFSDPERLDYPQYTRPPEFRGMRVPEVLLGGNHKAIAEWRAHEQLVRTTERRPDLLSKETKRRQLEKNHESA